VILRRAELADIPAMLALKAALGVDRVGADAARAGFLLGSDAAGYAARIAGASCFVVGGGELVGFAIALPDAAFRASDVWARRAAVAWDMDPGPLLERPIAYVDQLAVRGAGPEARRWGAAVALRAALDALRPDGALVATTVEAPLLNLAAVPYLRRVGARRYGTIDEVYPGVGPVRSAVWAAPAEAVYARVDAPRGLAEAWVARVGAGADR
jgi:hypothetical protein